MLDEWQISFICASTKHELEVTRCFFMRILVLLCVFAIPFVGSAQEPEAYILKSIYFGEGSFYIDDEQFFELKHLVDSIPELKDYTITIHSHTDNIGGAEYNEWLSEMRGRAAIECLLNLSFKTNQIEIRDFGQFNPIYDNSTWEGRSRNRRVDIIFWPVVM